ncbi:MAG TPA: PEP-CTERM sorting domain-containing protein [Methylomirabilota bacterium]|nr:PEP-CTERM sorting domain-containing protein [Methylomirabilota bacterium]
MSQFLDIVGPAYVQNNLGAGTFTEFGAFKAVGHDGGAALPGTAELTGTLAATGTFSLGGSVTFTGGTVNVYSGAVLDFASTTGIYGANNGALVGSFTILPGGGGPIDTAGVPNGFITANLQATFLAPGYFLAPDGVTNLSSLGLVLGFSTTNASFTSNPSQTVQDEIGCEGLLLLAPGCNPPNTPPTSLFLGANGQFRVAIPEPSSLMLLGGGLLLVGLLGLGRKKA